jgi:hypothetical protein
MKKLRVETLEKEPVAVGAKILEIKEAKEETDRKVMAARLRSEMTGGKTLKRTTREFIKPASEPMPLKIKKTHSLGDFYGKFHPSKSTKGIKRSE